MNLLTFEDDQENAFFVVENRKEEPLPDSEHGASRWQRIRVQVHTWYQRLQERFDHSERVCSNLRHAEVLRIHHSPSRETDWVARQFQDFLTRSSRKHTRWMWIDCFLACLGILMIPVPGPNVFFFYPAARALAHYFARSGAVRAQGLEWIYGEEQLIDIVKSHLQNLEEANDALRTLEHEYNVGSLVDQLKHLRLREV